MVHVPKELHSEFLSILEQPKVPAAQRKILLTKLGLPKRLADEIDVLLVTGKLPIDRHTWLSLPL